MNPEIYDFRKPARLSTDLEQRLTAWLRGCCTLAPGQWAKHLPVRLEMSFQGLETIRPTEGLARFSDATVGYRVIVNPGEMHTLLLMPRPFVLALVNAALGDTSLELLPDRELTTVEDAVCEYLIQRLLLTLIQETWTGEEPLQITLGAKEPHTKWVRLFPGGDNLVINTFTISGTTNAQDWHWIVPQKGLLERLGRVTALPEARQQGESQSRLQAVVCELPVELSVVLGVVELSLSQLSRLRAGDVVLLTQRVSEPLSAFVAGEQRFRVWPGRMGSRQAVRIESLTES